MANLPLFSMKREELGQIEVSDKVFATEVKEHLFYEVIKWQLAKRRSGTASTKGRNDVAGGGQKPYKQKGTGRARQGSRRAPNHVGGGTVHGPKPRSFAYRINKKLRQAAVRCALSKRAQEGRLLVVKDLGMDQIKTRSAAAVFGLLSPDPSLSKRRSESGHALVLGPSAGEAGMMNLKRSVRNLPKVDYLPVDAINLYDILNHRYLIVREPEVRHLEELLG